MVSSQYVVPLYIVMFYSINIGFSKNYMCMLLTIRFSYIKLHSFELCCFYLNYVVLMQEGQLLKRTGSQTFFL